MLIPTLSSLSIDNSQLDDLMSIGFCYVTLPHETLITKIQTCLQVARTFFQAELSEKEKWRLPEVLKSDDRYQGYVLRSQSKNTNTIEQIFFEPDAPFGPYEKYASLIAEINNTFMNQIALPLISAIFQKLQIKPANFIEVTTKPTCSLVFQSFKSIGEPKDVVRLNAHKDFGLMTVLYFEEPGLEVKFENDWQTISPQKNCVVVNLGNALELMTGQRCHSALHRVRNAPDARISMVYFMNPNYQQPVRNYADNSIIAANGEAFFKQQFKDYYEVDH